MGLGAGLMLDAGSSEKRWMLQLLGKFKTDLFNGFPHDL